MKTSYFANLKHLYGQPLSISAKAPDWYTGPQCRKLAPTWEILSAYKAGELDEEGYTEEFYKSVLSEISARDTYEFLTKTYGDNVVLLCYEKPGDFCHRRLVANWFEQSLGVEVPEFVFLASPLLGF